MNIARLQHVLRAACLALCLAAASPAVLAENKSDLWWNPAEAGRGLIVIDHETDMFVVWCTYDWGLPMWFVVPGGTLSDDGRVFEGKLYQTFSVGYGEVQAAQISQIGTARIDFAPGDLPRGQARYTLTSGTGQSQLVETHELTRQAFGSAGTQWGSDATDMWWDRENSGWGVAAIQHGSGDIFAVILTYDYSGNPVFFVSPSRRETEENSVNPVPNQFNGRVYATKPPPGALLEVRDAGFALMRLVGPTGGGPTMMTFDTDVSWVPQHLLTRLPFGRKQP
jgi:hypothetical protein